MTLEEEAREAAFPNTFRAGVAAALARIDQHIPSMTDDNVVDMIEAQGADLYLSGEVEYANLAIRTCACGASIDGFYQYVDHLKDVLRVD